MRIAGVVVAVDERESKRIYTIDDSSGATIECVVAVGPRVVPGNSAATATATATAAGQAASKPNVAHPLPVVDAPIDVGHIIDIKGSVGTWWEKRQIRAQKISHLRSTEQEMLFWEKVTLLRREVLSKPWTLDPREVRRCRREEEGRRTSRRHRREAKDGDKDQAGRTRAKSTMGHHGRSEGGNKHERKVPVIRSSKKTGLERKRPAKPITSVLPVTGHYDALGL